jgi:hypothetical protein
MPASEKKAATPVEEAKASSGFLSLDAINAAQDRPEITLHIPEWNGAVKLQGLSYDALNHARQQSFDQRKRETNEDLLNAWCLALGMLEPQITVNVAKQWIMERAFGPVNMILSEILTASGLGKRAADEAKSTPSS